MKRHRRYVLVIVAGAALAWALVGLSAIRADGPARPRPGGQPADAAVPFPAGEHLDYRVGWQDFLTAATARLRVVERRPFYGRVAWHFQARARTVEPVRLLYTLDDQFDSYTDTTTLAALQYEAYLREQGKQEDSIVRMSTEDDPAPGDGPSVRVPPGTRDPLGLFYGLRAIDWSQTREMHIPVYDGKKLYEVRACKAGVRQAITVPAGSYAATKIELRVFERGRELRNTLFTFWLAEDEARTPVLVRADLPFGTFRVELERVR